MAKSSPKEARKPAGKRIKLLAVAAAAICLFSGLLSPVQWLWKQLYAVTGLGFSTVETFTITFLDVGSADAAIIQSPDCTILIDGGTYDFGRKIYRRLSHMGIDHLDLMINTHPDKDHLGGFSQVLNKISVDAYWEPQLPQELIPKTEEYRLTRQALAETQTPIQTVCTGDSAVFGAVTLQVLSPSVSATDTNNNSLVLKITCGGRSILMMGDAEEKQEETLVEEEIACDVLKVGHHGSNTSTTEEFLEQVSPSIAVISSGAQNPPDEEVLDRLHKVGAEIYQTHRNGDISLTIKNGEILISPQKTT